MAIKVSYERKRGCGYRKGGGIYIVADGDPSPCCKLPIPLTVCPTCNAGIKPARGWTWVNLDPWISDPCRVEERRGYCYLSEPVGKVGLIWVGEKFYPTPADFVREAVDMGVSRRVTAIPKDFKLGETIVVLAHRKAIPDFENYDPENPKWKAAIFYCLKPTALEYIVKGDETDEEIEALEKRGLTPVKVVPVREGEDQQRAIGDYD